MSQSALYLRVTRTQLRSALRASTKFYLMPVFGIGMNIYWQDRVPDTEILKRAGIQSLYPILRSRLLRWLGHVARTDDLRIPKQTLYGELLGHA